MALTRAQTRLYLSAAEGRNFDGSPRYPSRFVLDIDQDLLYYPVPPREGLIRESREAADRSRRYLPEDESGMVFPAGTRVRHALFGPGTVLEADRDRGAHLVQFDELDTPRRISFRAKLERC